MSKKIIGSLFIGCALLFFLLGRTHQTSEEKLDQALEKMTVGSNSPSTSVLIIDHGKIVYKKSFGYSDVETLEKATPKTNYRLASLTKMFTAMSIIILHDRGLLDYDTKVSDIFDDFPAYGKNITIRHLLTHRSGLKDYYDYTDLLNRKFDVTHQLLDKDVYEIIKKMDDTYFESGSSFKYSDTGYTLLGRIVEKISGTKLSDFMKENIFVPLEMNDTVAFDKELNLTIPNRAYGADSGDTAFITKDQSYSSAVLGDGGVYSSLEDLYKWDQGLYGEKLVSKASLTEAYTPPLYINSKFDNYSSGWFFRKNANNELEQLHTGGTQGFTTLYLRIPGQQKTLIVLTNKNENGKIFEIERLVRQFYNFGSEGVY